MTFETQVTLYLDFCRDQKRLDKKTIKAYRIDLYQYLRYLEYECSTLSNQILLSNYIISLHNTYEPKTVKRKIASLKAFARYNKDSAYLSLALFEDINTKFREPKKLPKVIELHTLQNLMNTIYTDSTTKTDLQKKRITRDIAIVELLFGTGMRISELCNLKKSDIDLQAGVVRIYGKGAKERVLPISNQTLLSVLKNYLCTFDAENIESNYFFINNKNARLTEQSVRLMIKKYTKRAGISQHITPHMFRHTFASMLLDQDVDIRYIQKMLGHSSISVTEIYTFVSNSKQRDILLHKSPRNLIEI